MAFRRRARDTWQEAMVVAVCVGLCTTHARWLVCHWKMVRCPRLVVHLARSSMMAIRAVVVAVLKLVAANLDTLVRRAIQWVPAVDLVAWYIHLVVDTQLVLDHLVANRKRMAWYTQLDTHLVARQSVDLGNSLENLVIVMVVRG